MVHTEESQLSMENSEGRSQHNQVEKDTLLESEEDDDTGQENIFFMGKFDASVDTTTQNWTTILQVGCTVSFGYR